MTSHACRRLARTTIEEFHWSVSVYTWSRRNSHYIFIYIYCNSSSFGCKMTWTFLFSQFFVVIPKIFLDSQSFNVADLITHHAKRRILISVNTFYFHFWVDLHVLEHEKFENGKSRNSSVCTIVSLMMLFSLCTDYLLGELP